ncbi:DUF4288 domain-containing protein [Mucilaginibacter sp. CSA2-8R]|uniref:DUF4288 domain-containing protein n=1 Tax=Mucilaginibacter sp. CSA2-8R TaxID=3141542 RepID=UPI00315C74D5
MTPLNKSSLFMGLGVMSMKKISNLSDWAFKPDFDNSTVIETSIHLMYPDYRTMLDLAPAERIKKIKQDQRDKLKKLLATGFFPSFTIISTSRKPRGIKARHPFLALAAIAELDFVGSIFINQVAGARKVRHKKPLSFFCVKMTVAVAIEGFTTGMQKVEERMVIVKAKTGEDAIAKLEETKESYSQPYLNSDGRLVSWNIESFDDYYETDIRSVQDLNNPDGVEVYSHLRSRKIRPKE